MSEERYHISQGVAPDPLRAFWVLEGPTGAEGIFEEVRKILDRKGVTSVAIIYEGVGQAKIDVVRKMPSDPPGVKTALNENTNISTELADAIEQAIKNFWGDWDREEWRESFRKQYPESDVVKWENLLKRARGKS